MEKLIVKVTTDPRAIYLVQGIQFRHIIAPITKDNGNRKRRTDA